MLLRMAKLNGSEIEQMIGSKVDHFVARAPKKNHDAMVQLSKQFADIMRKYGVTNLYFQLNNTESPMEGITNIAKAISIIRMKKSGWNYCSIKIVSTGKRSAPRCKMMKGWAHFTNNPCLF